MSSHKDAPSRKLQEDAAILCDATLPRRPDGFNAPSVLNGLVRWYHPGRPPSGTKVLFARAARLARPKAPLCRPAVSSRKCTFPRTVAERRSRGTLDGQESRRRLGCCRQSEMFQNRRIWRVCDRSIPIRGRLLSCQEEGSSPDSLASAVTSRADPKPQRRSSVWVSGRPGLDPPRESEALADPANCGKLGPGSGRRGGAQPTWTRT